MLNNIVGLLAPQVAASTNSYESIETIPVGSGGSSSITFNSIPQTYKHLQVRAIGRTATTTQDYIIYKPNGNNVSARHFLAADGSSPSAGGSTSVFDLGIIPKSDSTANVFGAYVLDLLDYTDTNKNKTLRQFNGVDLNGTGYINFASALYSVNTNAITSLTITTYSSTAFAQYSTFALYGIKG